MRIGIDARSFGTGMATGIGRYVQELIQNLEKLDRKNQYVIFLRKENFNLYQPRSKNFSKVLADVPWYGVKEQVLLPAIFSSQGLDLMHFPNLNVPLLYSGKFVVTIHDSILLNLSGRDASTLPLPVYLIKKLGLRLSFWKAATKSSAILTPSKFVKDDLSKSFKLNPEKFFVTYESGNLAGKGRTDEERKIENVLERYKVTPPFFTYIGNLYPHKNISRLLDAIKILNEDLRRDAQLVLVGKHDAFAARLAGEIIRKGVLKYVLMAGYMPDADYADLLKESAAYVHPSLSEGFGLGSVEAMSLGVPVVQSNASCLPEICGDAALYFDPYDPKDMAAKLAKILGNERLRKQLSKKGLARAKRFSWEKMAKETLKVYEKVLR